MIEGLYIRGKESEFYFLAEGVVLVRGMWGSVRAFVNEEVMTKFLANFENGVRENVVSAGAISLKMTDDSVEIQTKSATLRSKIVSVAEIELPSGGPKVF